MAKFRKKPIIVDAEQWTKDCEWWEPDSILYGVKPVRPDTLAPPCTVDSMCEVCGGLMWDHGWVKTLEGGMLACLGDWIIRGVKGEKYPIKPDILALTYDRLEPPKPLDIDLLLEEEKADEDVGTKFVKMDELDERILPTTEDLVDLIASGLADPNEDTKTGKDMRYLQRLNNFCNDRCLLHSSSEQCKACPVMRERKRHMPDFDKL